MNRSPHTRRYDDDVDEQLLDAAEFLRGRPVYDGTETTASDILDNALRTELKRLLALVNRKSWPKRKQKRTGGRPKRLEL